MEGCTEMGKDGNKYQSLGKYLGFENSSFYVCVLSRPKLIVYIWHSFFLSYVSELFFFSFKPL